MNQDQNVGSAPRVLSIDALRGMDMFWIIGGEGLFAALFVLTGGSIWQTLAAQMSHSQWHGLRFYDLIFPLFIFLSGVSLGLSAKQLTGNRMPVYLKATRRLFLLLLLGVIYNHGWGTGIPASWDGVRYASVLGRIGISWFFAALLVWHFNLRTQIAIASFILLSYWALLALVTVDGYGGVYTLEHSINSWVDQHFLPGIRYQNLPLDPEGLLSNLPSIVNAMIGVFAGRLIQNLRAKPWILLRNLTIFGITCLAVGWLWHLVFPVNKSLWTSSFVLVTSGFSLLLLAFFYCLCDVLLWRRWAKIFSIIGVNAIAIYMASSLVNWQYSANSLFAGLIAGTPSDLQPLLQVFALLSLQLLLLGWMYKKKIFVKV